MTTAVASPPDTRALRDAFGRFATGVAVVTALDRTGAPTGEPVPVGLTVNSFSSVSLDPPMVLWSLGRNSALLAVFENASHYAINILNRDQEDLSNLFASRRDDKFAEAPWQPGPAGSPLLTGCRAWFEVENTHRYPGGDHLIFVGTVTDFQEDMGPAPLLFVDGRYAAVAER